MVICKMFCAHKHFVQCIFFVITDKGKMKEFLLYCEENFTTFKDVPIVVTNCSSQPFLQYLSCNLEDG